MVPADGDEPTLLTAYLSALVFSLVLIGASLVLGGDSDADAHLDMDAGACCDLDADAQLDFDASAGLDLDADAGLDVGAPADHDIDLHDVALHDVALHGSAGQSPGAHGAPASSWLPFLSLRFWTFGLGAFGLTGALLVHIDRPPALHVPLAALMGLGVGWGVASTFRHFKRAGVDSSSDLDLIQGAEGVVLLPVGPSTRGKVRLRLKGQDVDVVATTREPLTIERHAPVLVVHASDGLAEVVPLPRLGGGGEKPERS